MASERSSDPDAASLELSCIADLLNYLIKTLGGCVRRAKLIVFAVLDQCNDHSTMIFKCLVVQRPVRRSLTKRYLKRRCSLSGGGFSKPLILNLSDWLLYARSRCALEAGLPRLCRVLK